MKRLLWLVCLCLVAPSTLSCQESKEPGRETKNPAKEIVVDLGGGVKLELVLIPAGEFMMGSGDSAEATAALYNQTFVKADAFKKEHPQHSVRITKPFYLGKYLVTQEQWEAVMGSNPSHFKGPKNPVEQVSWDDCQQFLEKLQQRQANTPGTFQLPTEAQWNTLCAGSNTRYYFGNDEARLGDYAWFCENSDATHPVGQKTPNAWGLYDMHGNVLEWCQDWEDAGYYARSPANDPTNLLPV